jgi:hypothetical protein
MRLRTDWLFFESPSRSIFLFEQDFLGKPVPAFPDRALGQQSPWQGKAPSAVIGWRDPVSLHRSVRVETSISTALAKGSFFF